MESQGGCGKWVCLVSCDVVFGRVRFSLRCVEGCQECIKVTSGMCQGNGECFKELW